MADDDPIFQGDFVKLSEGRRLFIGSKSDTWKPKHIILRRKGDKPVLEYHKKKHKNQKKGERTLTNSFELWPTFKVEKLTNARGRAFVCEITAPDIHQFLSADQENDIDIFVFLLQSQIQLKENLREDIVSVVPDDAESQIKIGAKGSRCFLHISPWGVTLALEKSRSLLAQWPLKSIRYYETSGNGHFTIEAGRVAPMGEGIFGFRTAMGEDDKTYDLVDNYIVNTLDRVKPSQRGTQEEIEDYIREHDFLHSLTMVCAKPKTDPEVMHALKQCWNIGNGAGLPQNHSLDVQPSQSQIPSTARSSASSTQTASLNITLEWGNSPGNSNTFPSDARSSKRPNVTDPKSPSDGRPPLPSRVAKRSRRRDHSLPRKIDVAQSSSSLSDDITSQNSASQLSQQRQSGASVVSSGLTTPELPAKQNRSSSSSLLLPGSVQPRRHSNPSNVIHQVKPNSPLSLNIHPYQNQQSQEHHTEFYNLNSPNLKVRVSKSPIITRHPNKVGRAEYLLSVQESGVRSPTSPEEIGKKWDLSLGHSSEDENQETKRYLDAVARASQKKYGAHNSLDRSLAKARKGGSLERDRQSLGADSLNSQSGTSGYVNSPRVSGGYVNLKNNQEKEKIKLQDRQSSVESFTSALSRQSSLKTPTSPTPSVQHHRQRSAPVETDWSPSGHQGSPLLRPKGATGSDAGKSSHEDSGVSLRSRHSQLSSDDGLSRDSTHSIGSFKSAASRQQSRFSGLDPSESPVTNWLMSASCEDLSDHMRHVIFDDGEKGENPEEYESTYEEINSTKDTESVDAVAVTNSSIASDDKPPLPFTGLKKYQNNATVNGTRDRSKSFGYMNISQGVKEASALPVKQPSAAPSAHLIRKMVSARAKQETLRKSLSNPNFLNLGSKEQLFKQKINSRTIGSSSGNLSASNDKLGSGTKAKSRSFGNLFPAIKKALSRESIGHSRSTTPERRSSLRRSSFSFRRRSSDHDIGLRRQNSLHTPGEMTIKGIRMTTRSRSFRRVRETKSVEGLSGLADSENIDSNRSDFASTSSSVSNSGTPEKVDGSRDSQTQLRTSNSSTSIKTIPDQISQKSPNSSAQSRMSSGSASLRTASNQMDLNSNSSQTKLRTSSSSTSIKTMTDKVNPGKSNSSNTKKSDSRKTVTNPSYSANINITLSSPENLTPVSTSSPSKNLNPVVSLSSRDSYSSKSTIPSSSHSHLPPPIPPRQKSSLPISHPNSFSTPLSSSSIPSNYMNTHHPPPSSARSDSSSQSSKNRNSHTDSNSDIKQTRANHKVTARISQSKDKFESANENPQSPVKVNGERSRPARRRSGFDKVAPKT